MTSAAESGRRRVLAVRHVHFEDLGAFRPVLESRGFQIRYLDVGAGALELDASEPELMVVLGGPIGAYEEESYPFLVPELRLIAERIASGRPLLGICLGAQLMARAMGAVVQRGPEKEIGWGPVALTATGRSGPFGLLGTEPVLHWHGDVLDLPAGAERLASTAITPNQAFAAGPGILGIQFHPEAETEGFERWLIGHAAEIAQAGLSPEILRRETARYAGASAARGQAMFARWLDEAGL